MYDTCLSTQHYTYMTILKLHVMLHIVAEPGILSWEAKLLCQDQDKLKSKS